MKVKTEVVNVGFKPVNLILTIESEHELVHLYNLFDEATDSPYSKNLLPVFSVLSDLLSEIEEED